MMHKLPRPASSSNYIFIMAGRQKKTCRQKKLKIHFTPHKNVLKEIQRLPAKEASILLQFVELACCVFELSCCFLMCSFLFMAASFEINVTGSSSEFSRTRVRFFQFLPKFR